MAARLNWWERPIRPKSVCFKCGRVISGPIFTKQGKRGIYTWCQSCEYNRAMGYFDRKGSDVRAARR